MYLEKITSLLLVNGAFLNADTMSHGNVIGFLQQGQQNGTDFSNEYSIWINGHEAVQRLNLDQEQMVALTNSTNSY